MTRPFWTYKRKLLQLQIMTDADKAAEYIKVAETQVQVELLPSCTYSPFGFCRAGWKKNETLAPGQLNKC